MDRDSISQESHDSVKEYVTVPDVSLEGDPHPELVYFIVQRLNISGLDVHLGRTRRTLGAVSGISSIALGGKNKGSNLGSRNAGGLAPL